MIFKGTIINLRVGISSLRSYSPCGDMSRPFNPMPVMGKVDRLEAIVVSKFTEPLPRNAGRNVEYLGFAHLVFQSYFK